MDRSQSIMVGREETLRQEEMSINFSKIKCYILHGGFDDPFLRKKGLRH